MKPLKLKPPRRVLILSALVFLSLAGVPWKTGPLAHGALLDIVSVSAPAINCIFDLDCTITVTDTADHFTLAGTAGDAFLQSRTFPAGEPGTVAEGLYAYLYRIDLRDLAGITHIPCVTSFSIEFGPVVPLNYDGIGVADDVFVVTAGGLGTVGPVLADQVGDAITFTFDPAVCPGSFPGDGETTFFFGLTSVNPPRFVTAQVKDTQALVYNLEARAPHFRPEFRPLDHFKCYVTEGSPVGEPVVLGDQFSNRSAEVLQAIRFCNPVEKIQGDRVTPVQDKDAHLKLYEILTFEPTGEPAQRREVIVRNQFGELQHLDVSEAVALAVPTQKLRPNFHPPPRGLDHFLCYVAKGKPVDVVVGLRDEFHSETVQVVSPFLLCNPVVKVHHDLVTPILNPKDHLVCYRIRGGPFQGNVFARNQFGNERLTVGRGDVLCVPSEKGGTIPKDPNIQKLCGEKSVLDFDGGNVLPGDPGPFTGLFQDNPTVGPPWPDGRPHRPCGKYVPIDGFLPSGNVAEFRVAYRPAGDPVPPVGTAPGIQTKWNLWEWNFFPWPGGCLTDAGPFELQTDSDGWMDASDYLDAKTGALTGCVNSLRLAVWDTNNEQGLGVGLDPNGHYVVWLEWKDNALVLHKELTEHHIQLDNTLPVINDLLITLADGTTPVPACGEAEPGNIFKVFGDFEDDFYWYYSLAVRGGDPPAAVGYGPHNYFDGTSEVANTGTTGTTPSATTVLLRPIDMNDLGASFTDCCYLLDLWVFDAAIRYYFINNIELINGTGSTAFADNAFTTFAASPGP